jgi:hypothetical protein
MYFLHNYFIWIRKIIIRILIKEYPNKLIKSKNILEKNSDKNINFISSTDNFWISNSMFKKWNFYYEIDDIDLNIYSNSQVNSFMKKYFKNDLIYEIFKKSVLPVQKIDIFRICIIYKFGGIWLDIKSQINITKVLKLYKDSESNGILLSEPRKIEVITSKDDKQLKSFKNVIHNGFFFLPKESQFLKNILFKIKKDYLYFQDIIFSHPKQGIMNLTGPHQFTRTYYDLEREKRPLLVSHNDIDWVYYQKFGEYISPLKIVKHYSSIKEVKTIDSLKSSNLKEK